MTETKREVGDPVESLDSIEMNYVGKDTVVVTGYDDEGNFCKEFYRHDYSVVKEMPEELEDTEE